MNELQEADWNQVQHKETYDGPARQAAYDLLAVVGIPVVTWQNHVWIAERIRAWEHACAPLGSSQQAPTVELATVRALVGLRTNGPRRNRAQWLRRLAEHVEFHARSQIANEAASIFEAKQSQATNEGRREDLN